MNKSPDSAWQRWSDAVAARTLRERILLMLCALGVLIAVWQLVFEWPQQQKREQFDIERSSLQRQRETLQAQAATFSGEQPGGSMAQQVAELEAQRAELDARLASLSQGLVSAKQLPDILREVLVSTTELQLERVRTLPVESLMLEVADGDAESAATGVYRHSVELDIRGDYAEVLAFLRRLESLPWRFYWGRLTYEVDQYPLGSVRLRVYTLSAEEGLIGV